MDTTETFEQKIQNIENIITKLSHDEISLDESLKLYEQGTQKLKEAQELLEKANLIFEEIKQKNISQSNGD